MKTKALFLLIIAIVSSCIVGKQGVEYAEMSKQPTIQILNNNIIVINTENSIKNSALSIYKVDYSIDTIKKEIYLYGFQAINKKNQNRFEVKINKLSHKQLQSYEYFWVDPDKKKTKIEIKNN
mgnify:CR=1 FL=1